MTGYESKKAMAQDKLAQPAQELWAGVDFDIKTTTGNYMKVEEIIDYAWPCMCAEKALKQAHQAMLERDYVKAIENTNAAIDDCKAMLKSIRTIASKDESLLRQ